jgi:GT2 family glycosyltransferase
LFLNPDTIISEDSLIHCLSSLEENANSGAVGVRMIDGSGEYLKESKRGLPSPWAAASKLLGLTAIFPRSKFFSTYYLGHLDENQNNPVDVLSGAFMMVRRDILLKIGGFDEQFFYGRY